MFALVYTDDGPEPGHCVGPMCIAPRTDVSLFHTMDELLEFSDTDREHRYKRRNSMWRIATPFSVDGFGSVIGPSE